MDLPVTDSGNHHVVVFQDFPIKWPLVFPVPDQKAVRLVRLLTEEVIPLFGVPEALLSDRGTNLMSTLMLDICKKLGIHKLNTTAYHPECDGMVEQFNCTLKTALKKHAALLKPSSLQPGLLAGIVSHFIQQETLQQRLYRKLSSITNLYMTARSNLLTIILVIGSW